MICKKLGGNQVVKKWTQFVIILDHILQVPHTSTGPGSLFGAKNCKFWQNAS